MLGIDEEIDICSREQGVLCTTSFISTTLGSCLIPTVAGGGNYKIREYCISFYHATQGKFADFPTGYIVNTSKGMTKFTFCENK
jgi:hypothetical protein